MRDLQLASRRWKQALLAGPPLAMSRLCCCVSTAQPPSALPPQAAAEEPENGGLGAVPSQKAPHPAGSGGAAELHDVGQTDAQAAGGAGQGGAGADAPPAQRTAALEPAPATQPEPEQELSPAEPRDLLLLLKPPSDDDGNDDAPNATYLAVRQPLPSGLEAIVSKRTKAA
eukprot:COSAG04_NODE_662_length_11447_cov_3.759958_2_plen_171_part_00